jgi:hypothetical protein
VIDFSSHRISATIINSPGYTIEKYLAKMKTALSTGETEHLLNEKIAESE